MFIGIQRDVQDSNKLLEMIRFRELESHGVGSFSPFCRSCPAVGVSFLRNRFTSKAAFCVTETDMSSKWARKCITDSSYLGILISLIKIWLKSKTFLLQGHLWARRPHRAVQEQEHGGHHRALQQGTKICTHRGLVLCPWFNFLFNHMGPYTVRMTSEIILNFLTPPTCLHFHATSLTKPPYCICFWYTSFPPPCADIICTCPLNTVEFCVLWTKYLQQHLSSLPIYLPRVTLSLSLD